MDCQSKTGSLAPKPQGRAPGTAGKLAPHVGFLTDLVGAEPDVTLQEPADALVQTHGVSDHLSPIPRALDKAGLAYEKRSDRHGAAARKRAAAPWR